jgi:hypothetical protein
MRIARWLGWAAVLVAGCGQSTWELSRAGGDAGADADHDAGPSCSGQCVPAYPVVEGWELAVLWTGPENAPPACGKDSDTGLDGYTDLLVSNDCPACACDPPVGSCKPPVSMTVHSEACYQPGSMDMPFDPPADWNGICNADTAIPVDCGGVPCARSVTIGPMEIANESCMPSEQPIPHATPPQPTWGRFARGCRLAEHVAARFPDRCSWAENCLPSVDPFLYCYRKAGDVACLGHEHTERIVVYTDYDDQRKCTDCACGPPQGSVCKGLVTVYEDSACMQPAGACMPDSSNPCCMDFPPGTALGSKDVAPPAYHPGVCEPMGSTVVGRITLIEPRTYCCWVPKG